MKLDDLISLFLNIDTAAPLFGIDLNDDGECNYVYTELIIEIKDRNKGWDYVCSNVLGWNPLQKAAALLACDDVGDVCRNLYKVAKDGICAENHKLRSESLRIVYLKSKEELERFLIPFSNDCSHLVRIRAYEALLDLNWGSDQKIAELKKRIEKDQNSLVVHVYDDVKDGIGI